jgi:ketosteroid isomerase-like protein
MADQNLDTVRGAYEAFGRGDLPGVLAILADDIAWSVPPPLPQAGDAHGRDEVGAFFQRLGALWEDLSLELDDFVASGDRVCVIGRGSGKVDGQQTGYGRARLDARERQGGPL